MVAPDEDRQRRLLGLRERFDVLEVDVSSMEAGPTPREQQSQGLNPFSDEMPPVCDRLIREQGLVFLPVRARADTDDQASARELVEGGKLLCRDDYVAEGKHEQAGCQTDP